MLKTTLASLLTLLSLATLGCGTTVSGELDSEETDETTDVDDGPTPCSVGARECGDGQAIQYCTLTEEGEEEWTSCCEYEIAECECPAPWDDEQEPCDTPLVLSFDQRAVAFTSEPGAAFDLTREETSFGSDWPTSATPWLAFDVNGNGSIDDGGELFGSATRMGDSFASNGFMALTALDDNADGVVDCADARFASLVVWRDADHSRTSEPSELEPASVSVLSIDLGYTVDRRCDARGNCEVERATFRTVDAHGNLTVGAVVDVHLPRR